MAYQLKNLDVASLDFSDIRTSLINFFKQQPDLADLDFDNDASSVNLLINILATATAYNGVYAQFGYVNSFATTSTLLSSILGIAANSSVLITPTQSATTTRTITAVGTTLEDYSTFKAVASDSSDIFFFNVDSVPASTSKSITLYSGTEVVSYTNYDYKTQSCVIPYNIDPRTVSFYETATGTGVVTKWTLVTKGSYAATGNQNTFTIINGPNGYIVTNNFPTAKTISTTSTVLIKAIATNGSVGNNATLYARSDATFGTFGSVSGGYDEISVNKAKYSLLFNATGQDRCVTIADFVNAILSSGISGTSDESNITVQTDCCIPGTIRVYVTGLSSTNQTALMSYLNSKAVAGIRLVYQQ
jgi:hypothetical protein